MYSRHTLSRATTVLALSLVSFPAAHAQTAVDGAIGGSVVDTTGAAVPNATITVHNNGTAAETTLKADSSGFFRALHLDPGTYNVIISAPGFETYRSINTVVQVGVQTTLQPQLAAGAATQEITVIDTAPLVNTTSPDFADVIPQETVHDLPENNYRWSAYALLTPGVVNDSNGYGLLSFRGQSTLLNNIEVDGTDDNQAFFSEERGRTRAGYSTIKESIQEFQVNTADYSSEYGRAAGGVVNSVTKSGTNAFHGEGYYFDRDSAWAAINPTVVHPVALPGGGETTEPFKPTDLRRQYGFTIGGPFIKDKLFFFFAGDRFFHDFPAAATITGAAANANFYTPADTVLPAGQVCGGTGKTAVTKYADQQVCQIVTNASISYAAALPFYAAGTTGAGGLTSMLGTEPRTGSQTIWFPKLDWQINSKNHLAIEGNRLRWISPAGIQTSAAVADGLASFGNDYVRDTWGVAKLDTLFTPRVTNEARYAYGRDFEFEDNQTPTPYEQTNLTQLGNNPQGLPPNVALSSLFAFGTPLFLNRGAYPDERRWQVADTVDVVRGKHDIRFGGDILHTDDRLSNLYDQYGGFSYSGNLALGNYLSDLYLAQNGQTSQHYTQYSQGAGVAGLDFTTFDYSAFVQDQWKATRRLSLTAGVRWEFEQFPSTQLANPALPQTGVMPSNPGNVGPRVGFAYEASSDGKTVIRGGYGMFFARAINSTIYQALIGTGAPGSQITPLFNPGQANAPNFPQIVAPAVLGSVPGVATASFFDPNFKLPQIHQADLTVEQQIGKSDGFSVSWLGSFGRRLPDFVDTNLPKPTAVTFTVDDPNHLSPLPNNYTFVANTYLNARPNPNYGYITDIFSGVTSNYEALAGQYQHRFAQFFSLNGEFTWSHALDYGVNNTAGTSSSALLDPSNLRLDYGNSPQNVPTRGVVYAIADLPFHRKGPLGYLVNDFEIAPDFQAQSGLPYSLGISGSVPALTVTSGQALQPIINTASFNGSGGANRVPGIDRNIYQQPRINVVDLRLSKRVVVLERYRLEFLGEAFNLANHQNVTTVGANAYSPSVTTTGTGAAKVGTGNFLVPYTTTPFSSITQVNNSNFAFSQRQLQLAVRLEF